MESDCFVAEDSENTIATMDIPMKKNYLDKKEVLEDLWQQIPDVFLLQNQTECLKKYVSKKYPQDTNENQSEYHHRLEVQMCVLKDEIIQVIEQFVQQAINQNEYAHYGINWPTVFVKGVAKQFVYCILTTLYANNGVHVLSELNASGNSNEKLCERALKVFENYLRVEHINNSHNSLLSLSLVKQDKDQNIERRNRRRRKKLSTSTMEKYVAEATEFFVILGLLPITYGYQSRRQSITRRSNILITESPKATNQVVVGAILESDIHRYIDKCIQNIKESESCSIFLPRSKKCITQYPNNENEFWIKLDDFYKWLLLIFVQATALKSETIIGTADNATGALKIGNINICKGPNNSFKLTVQILRLRHFPKGQILTLLSTNKRFCPVKMMITWLAVRNVFKLPFSQCLQESNFEIKEESKDEWLFPESDQNGGIKARVWSCNVLSNAVKHFAKTMNLQNITVGSRSLRKGRIVQIYCKIIRGGCIGARAKLVNAVTNLPGWDNDVIYSQLKTPLYDDRTICEGYDQSFLNARNNGTTPPDPLKYVPSIIDMAKEIIPEEFEKTATYNRLFEEDYARRFVVTDLEKKQEEIQFLKAKENETSNSYSAKRLAQLQSEVNYRISASHKTDQKYRFRQRYLFGKYNKQNIIHPKKLEYEEGKGTMDLEQIASFSANFAEHCVGETQGLVAELCSYGPFKCPVKNCNENAVHAEHVSTHKVFECSICEQTKEYTNLPSFKKHFTDHHIPTHYCMKCSNYCSEAPPHKKECKQSVAINRKYIRLFFTSCNDDRDPECLCSLDHCLRNNSKVLSALFFPSLLAVANVCYSTELKDKMKLSEAMRKVFHARIKKLVITDNYDCAKKLFDEKIIHYLPPDEFETE